MEFKITPTDSWSDFKWFFNKNKPNSVPILSERSEATKSSTRLRRVVRLRQRLRRTLNFVTTRIQLVDKIGGDHLSSPLIALGVKRPTCHRLKNGVRPCTG